MVALFLPSIGKYCIFLSYSRGELHIIGGLTHMKAIEEILCVDCECKLKCGCGRGLDFVHLAQKWLLLVTFFTAFFRHGCI